MLKYRPCGGVPEWPKGPDCKSDGSAFGGSNPPPSTTFLFIPQIQDSQKHLFILKLNSFELIYIYDLTLQIVYKIHYQVQLF